MVSRVEISLTVIQKRDGWNRRFGELYAFYCICGRVLEASLPVSKGDFKLTELVRATTSIYVNFLLRRACDKDEMGLSTPH